VKLEFRAMTNSQRIRESAVMISSIMPSTKYSSSGPGLMFWNGITAIEGLSGSGKYSHKRLKSLDFVEIKNIPTNFRAW
jgi:hypothetical protein